MILNTPPRPTSLRAIGARRGDPTSDMRLLIVAPTASPDVLDQARQFGISAIVGSGDDLHGMLSDG